MITTSFLLLFISFEIWYLTSKQFKQGNSVAYIQKIISNAKPFRFGAGLLFAIAATIIIINLGWASGIPAVIVGLMAAGSLVVVLQPFRYIGFTSVASLYILLLLLEIFI